MKGIQFAIILLLQTATSLTLFSQDAVRLLDTVYGLDQTVCNGKKYAYASPSIYGHQYLFSPAYGEGSITVRGKCFYPVTVNYDLLNQQLLLQCQDASGSLNIVEVSKAWLNGFSMGTLNFELLRIESAHRFYQVLGHGPVRILYYWRKELALQTTIGTSVMSFTPPIRDAYVLIEGKLKPFISNRSLVRLFDPRHKTEIRTYLRKNKIKVKNASDRAMAEMITFIDNLR